MSGPISDESIRMCNAPSLLSIRTSPGLVGRCQKHQSSGDLFKPIPRFGLLRTDSTPAMSEEPRRQVTELAPSRRVSGVAKTQRKPPQLAESITDKSPNSAATKAFCGNYHPDMLPCQARLWQQCCLLKLPTCAEHIDTSRFHHRA